MLTRRPSTTSVLLLLSGVLVNLLIWRYSSLYHILTISTGTIVVGALAGPWYGGMTAILTRLLWAGMYAAPFIHAETEFAVGIAAGACFQYGRFKTWAGTLLGGLIIAAVDLLVGTLSAALYATNAGQDVTALFSPLPRSILYLLPAPVVAALLGRLLRQVLPTPWIDGGKGG